MKRPATVSESPTTSRTRTSPKGNPHDGDRNQVAVVPPSLPDNPLKRRAVALALCLAIPIVVACGPERSNSTTAQKRVVSLAPNLTDIVADLGCSERLVAIDTNSSQPSPARQLPQIDALEPSLEQLVGLDANLVIASASANQAHLGRALSNVGIDLLVVRTDRLTQIGEAYELLGAKLDCRDARRKRTAFESAVNGERRQRSKPPKVLFLAWHDPLYVAGRDSFADDLLQLAGAENAVPRSITGWPQYSREAVLTSPPDVILFPTGKFSQEEFRKMLASDPLWRRVPAVAEGRVYVVDENLFTRPGPTVPEAARVLNRLLDAAGYR